MIPPLTGSNLADADKSLQTGNFSTAPSTIARSYWSRRERLRQCVVAAGAENLPDYELLELMLFASNPRAKVESLAAQLLQRFGSLAEVLGANPAELAAAGLGIPAIAHCCPGFYGGIGHWKTRQVCGLGGRKAGGLGGGVAC